jgi:hypothetical protein
MKQFLAFVMIAFLLPTTAALAKNPCKDDKMKFCKDVKASGGKVTDCLAQHMNELSDACKEKLADKGKDTSAAKSDEDATDADEAPAEGAAPGTAETKPE